MLVTLFNIRAVLIQAIFACCTAQLFCFQCIVTDIYIYIYNFILTKLASKLSINSVTVDLKGRHLFLFLQLTFKKN